MTGYKIVPLTNLTKYLYVFINLQKLTNYYRDGFLLYFISAEFLPLG